MALLLQFSVIVAAQSDFSGAWVLASDEANVYGELRARWTREGLILEKSTDSGNGNFELIWTLLGNSADLIERERGHLPDDAIRFQRISSSTPARDSSIHVGAIGDDLRISCPNHRCRLVRFESGRRTGASELLAGEFAQVSLDSEVHVEAYTASPVPPP